MQEKILYILFNIYTLLQVISAVQWPEHETQYKTLKSFIRLQKFEKCSIKAKAAKAAKAAKPKRKRVVIRRL